MPDREAATRFGYDSIRTLGKLFPLIPPPQPHLSAKPYACSKLLTSVRHIRKGCEVALQTTLPIRGLELLNWGSGECFESNSGIGLAPSLGARICRRFVLPGLRSLAAPLALLLRTDFLYIFADCWQPAVLHLHRECFGALPRHA